MKNEALTNHLHDSFIHCGEILPAADIARIIREHEFDLAVEFDAQTVLASVREAGERFVDSMVQNEHDTEEAVTDGLYCGFPIDPLEARVAKWEAMRPSGNTMNHTPHNMKYTYQEISESGNWAMPQPTDVHHARSKRELRNALERWADTNDRYNDRRDASLMVWKGQIDDVTDRYPDFVIQVGPRDGAIFERC